jgi:hypothetical protein
MSAKDKALSGNTGSVNNKSHFLFVIAETLNLESVCRVQWKFFVYSGFTRDDVGLLSVLILLLLNARKTRKRQLFKTT